MRAGSAIVETTMQFLVAGGNTAPAAAFQSALESNLGSVLPPEDWPGASLQGSVASEEVELSLQESELSEVEAEDSNQTALIVGLAVGREWQQGREGRRSRCFVRCMMHRSVPKFHSTNDRSSGLGRREVEVKDALPLTWCLLPSFRAQWAAAPCFWPAWATGCGAAAAGVPAPAWCTATRSLLRAWLEQCPRGSANTTTAARLWQWSAPPRPGGRRRATLRHAPATTTKPQRRRFRSGMTGGKPLHIHFSA